MTILEFFKKYNFKISSVSGDELRCCCPIHNDRRPSFSINQRTGKWICFSQCGSGNFNTLKKRLGITEEIEITLELGSDDDIEKNVATLDLTLPYEYNPFSKDDLDRTDSKIVSYIKNRLSDETILHFNLGFCETGYYRNRIIIPLAKKEGIRGFVARAVDNEEMRYLYPKGFKTSKVVFNLDFIDPSQLIVLCESIFDMMTCWQLGIKNVVGVFGAHLSYTQVNALLNSKVRKLALCFHNDTAGKDLIAKRTSLLCETFDEVYIIDVPLDTDVNSLQDNFMKYYNLQYRVSQ